MAGPQKQLREQQLRLVDLYGVSRAGYTLYTHTGTHRNTSLKCCGIGQRRTVPVTWTEAVEVVVSSVREVPGEGVGVDFGRGGGIGAERKPPVEQVLLLHPGGLLVLCRGERGEEKVLINSSQSSIFKTNPGSQPVAGL